MRGVFIMNFTTKFSFNFLSNLYLYYILHWTIPKIAEAIVILLRIICVTVVFAAILEKINEDKLMDRWMK